VAQIPVNGVFPLEDTDRVLAALEHVFPIASSVTRYWTRVVAAAQKNPASLLTFGFSFVKQMKTFLFIANEDNNNAPSVAPLCLPSLTSMGGVVVPGRCPPPMS
jgi:hypothetical protein